MKKLMVLMISAVMVGASLGGNVFAQEAAGDSHTKAAESFLLSMQTPQQLQEGIDSMVDMMLQAQPMMMPYRQTIKDFYTKYLSWVSLKDDYIQITKDLLTEPELKELTAFFKTEVGKKFISKQPEMFERTSELGFNVMQENQQELMDILGQKAQEYGAQEEGDAAN